MDGGPIDPPEIETVSCETCAGQGSRCSWCHEPKCHCECKWTLLEIKRGFDHHDYLSRMEGCPDCHGGTIRSHPDLPRGYYA